VPNKDLVQQYAALFAPENGTKRSLRRLENWCGRLEGLKEGLAPDQTEGDTKIAAVHDDGKVMG
jgi:hypothetical protein